MFGTVPTYTPTTSAVAATLADIYDPTIFDEAQQEAAVESNAFLNSGVMQNDARIDGMANMPGSTGDLPFMHGLVNGEPNYSTDNPASSSTPLAIAGGKQTFLKAVMNESWSTMDLARELGLTDPLGAITGRIGHYWGVNSGARLIHSCQGIMLDNIANDSSDMTNAIHNEEGTAAIAANLVSAEAVIDTAGTLGDAAKQLRVIAMHSVIFQRLSIANLIDYIPDSNGVVNFPTYLGYRVVEDDSLAPRAGTTDGLVYTTILAAEGAIAYGSGTPTQPSELDRAPAAGDGGGQDIIYSRVTEIIHPYGFAFASSGIAGISATYAELAAAAQWNRVYQNRKNIGLAFLTTNG